MDEMAEKWTVCELVDEKGQEEIDACYDFF